jgi:hypothetical protein
MNRPLSLSDHQLRQIHDNLDCVLQTCLPVALARNPDRAI